MPYDKGYYEANKDKCRQLMERWREANRDKTRAFDKAYREANKSKIKSVRRAKEAGQATPKWANAEAMLEIYKEAAFLTEVLGVPYHVDHIVPLRSKIVCGLHCEQNLRVIEGVENIRKGNRHWPGMP